MFSHSLSSGLDSTGHLGNSRRIRLHCVRGKLFASLRVRSNAAQKTTCGRPSAPIDRYAMISVDTRTLVLQTRPGLQEAHRA